MNFDILFQLRNKKIWWIDVAFYFAISLLVAAVFCYGIFSLKIYLQKNELKVIEEQMLQVGTEQQKKDEENVFAYQKKISDFAKLIEARKISLNIFAFLEEITRPDIWYGRFDLNERDAIINLSGIAEDEEAFSRQTLAFEESKYLKELKVLNSSVGETGRVNFNLSLTFDEKIFEPVAEPAPEEQPQEEQ